MDIELDTTIPEGSEEQKGGTPASEEQQAGAQGEEGKETPGKVETTTEPGTEISKEAIQEALSAKETLNSILSSHDFETAEELQDALESGTSLQDILGDEDAATVLKEAQTLREYNKRKADEDREKLEESETPAETNARLKRENVDLQGKLTAKSDKENAQTQSQEAILTYNKEVGKILETTGIEGDDKEIASLLLGVDNPLDDLDIRDTKAVRRAVTTLAKQFKGFKDGIAQKAVDDYVAGKGGVPTKPVKEGAVEDTEKTPEEKIIEGKKIPENASIDEAFDLMNEQFLEVLTQSAKAQK